ncbi:helix-turn-helix domain-containing protein [Thiomonas sp. X19]|uniref:helix-turn-helix domain-containing protein n=1 Tax=Thiomonas sp. X19 TaxID=1050370 RepID=UPI000DD57D26
MCIRYCYFFRMTDVSTARSLQKGYLGLRLETVSRLMMRLHRDVLIEIEARRHLRILNRVALTALLTPPGDCL